MAKPSERGKTSPRGANPDNLSGANPQQHSHPKPAVEVRNSNSKPIPPAVYPYSDPITGELRSTPVSACCGSGVKENQCVWCGQRISFAEPESRKPISVKITLSQLNKKIGLMEDSEGYRRVVVGGKVKDQKGAEQPIAQATQFQYLAEEDQPEYEEEKYPCDDLFSFGDLCNDSISTPTTPEVSPTNSLPKTSKREIRPKQPKHAESNLKKETEVAHSRASEYKQKREPEANVSSSTPSQYQVDVVNIRGNNLHVADIVAAMSAASPEKSVTCEWGKGGLGYRGSARPPVVRLMDKDNLDNQCIEYHERRLIDVVPTKYTFPSLNFVGYWNNSQYSSGDEVFVKHNGVHFHGSDVEIELPGKLVEELMSWWSHRKRTKEEFLISVQKTKQMCSTLRITAEQQRFATLYAPAVAWIESWDEQQMVSRVVSRAYWRSAVGVSMSKSWDSLRTKTGLCILGATVVVGAAICVGSALLYQVLTQPSVCRELTRPKTRARFSWGVDVSLLPAENDWGLSKKVLNKLQHALNGNRFTGNLINCARLPQPKKLKPKASITLQDGELRMKEHLKDPESKKGRHCLYGFDTEGYAPVAFASNQHNEEQALYARVLADTDEPTDDLQACIEWCKTNHHVLFPKMRCVKSVPFSEYLKRSNASPSVKRTLQSTMNKLQSEGITEMSHLTRGQLYLWTKRSSFVKVENNLYESPRGMKDKAPRLIQGAMPEFICLVGPWIMALQDLLKRRWNTKRSNLVFTSGVKSEDAAAFIVEGQGKILEDDLGKFDCSIRRPWCEYEVWLCKSFGAPRAVLDLMTANISTHGTTLHGWKYKCDGTRKSGDPYTSLMNSIINGLSHLYLYCKWTGRTVHSASFTMRMLLQGDDNAMRHLEQVEFPWKEGMAGLGFDSEAIYRQSFEQLEFCSSRLYNTTSGYVFGPKPGKVLAKLGYIINPPINVSKESMLKGVALGLQKSCNHIPPLKTVIMKILQLTEKHEAYFDRKFMEHKMDYRSFHEATSDIQLSLDDQYGWSTTMQSEFEASMEGMKFGDKYSCIYSRLLFDRDTSGPQDIFCGMIGA
jgi:hypothetical protein